jgi:hypothetical protein
VTDDAEVRMVRGAGFKLVVAAVAVVLAAAATPVLAGPGLGRAAAACDTFDVSPFFATDHTVVCAARGKGGVSVEVSQDAGRSWRAIPVTFAGPTTGPDIFKIVVSPGYDTDHTVYLHTSAGLYASRDLSATFVPVDLTASTNAVPFWTLLPLRDSATGVVSFVLADQQQSARITPPAVHEPVPGAAPDLTHAFLAPRDTGPTSEPLALGLHQIDGIPRPAVYGCNAAFACTELRHTFGPGTALGAWLSPAYPTDDTVVVEVADKTGFTFYRSTDAGRTFAPWRDLMRVVTPLNRALLAHGGSFDQPAALVWDPTNPRRVYLRSTALSGRGGPPYDQLYRSDDAGRTWRRLGYALAVVDAPHGTLPWNATFTVQRPIANANQLAVAADGRVFALGEALGGGVDVHGFYCSTDHGAHWSRVCGR